VPRLAGGLEVAAEEDVAPFADEELVVAAAVFTLLRRVAAALDSAAVGVEFHGTDGLHQIVELRGENIAQLLEILDRGTRQLVGL